MTVRIITYKRSVLVNDEEYIGVDVHQAMISAAGDLSPSTNEVAR